MKAFRLLSKRSTMTVVPCKGIHQIEISFTANRLGEHSTSLQVRACKSSDSDFIIIIIFV